MNQPVEVKARKERRPDGASAVVRITAAARMANQRLNLTKASEELPALAWMTDVAGGRLWANKEWHAFTGCAHRQEPASDCLRLVHPSDLGAVERSRAAALLSGARSTLQYRLRRHDGEYRRMVETMQPRHDADGRLAGFSFTAMDVTDCVPAAEQSAHGQGVSHTILENLPGLCFVLDTAGRLILWNRLAREVTGYSDDELRNRLAVDLISEPHRARVLSEIKNVMTSGSGETEADVVTKAGTRRPFIFNARRIELDGKPCLLGVGSDLAERRRAEDLLHLNHTALMAAANAVVITDADGVIRWVNPAFSRLTGYAGSEVIGGKPNLLKSGQHSREHYRELWHTIRGGKVWEGEMINRRKDGSLYSEDMTITPVLDERGQITAFIAIKQDATERNSAQARIREQAAVLDQASDAILVCDLADKIRYWNRGAEMLFGWSAEEATGRAIIDLLGLNSVVFAVARAEALNSGTWSGEVAHAARDQRQILCQARWTLVRNEAGAPQSVLIILTDITEKKKLEAQLLRGQRLESLGQLAGGIAHDLNNILTPILIGAPMLREMITDEESVSLIDTMESSAQRGAAIVKQVLTFSRGIEGERVPVQMRHLVKEFTRIIQETFPRSIALRTEVKRDLWLVKGDSTQLHQVLMNLCVNARDAMADGGILTISLQNQMLDEAAAAAIAGAQPGPHVVLRVSDTGTGIAPEHLDRIFDPFFTTKDTGKGTGLGLSTVIGIVQSHRGVVQVATKQREGTDFKVYLPALDADTEAPQSSERTPDPKGNNELVLVVDDEDCIRRVCKRMLTANGYRVLLARDGLEAVGLFEQRKQDIKVVLTDLSMPRMDGITLIHALRSEPPSPRIIAASGMLSGVEAEAIKSLAIDAFLPKPLTASILLRTISEALKQAPVETAP